MLTNLADVLRGAGLPVVEVAGWKSRGHGQMSGVRGVLWHHTATPASRAGDYPSLGIVRDGRSDLPGPLANLGLGRNGTWYVIAAGLAYHAGAGSHPAVGTNNGNNWLIGVEAEHPGTSGTPWPAVQLESYRQGTAALLRAYGLGADRCIGHKEWAPSRKPDPIGLNMAAERGFVHDKIVNFRPGGSAPAPAPAPVIPMEDCMKDIPAGRTTHRLFAAGRPHFLWWQISGAGNKGKVINVAYVKQTPQSGTGGAYGPLGQPGYPDLRGWEFKADRPGPIEFAADVAWVFLEVECDVASTLAIG